MSHEREHQLPHHHQEAAGIIFETAAEHLKREEHERAHEQALHGRLQTRFNRLMLWMQSATVILSASTIAVSAYQIRFARLSTDAATQATSLAASTYMQTSASTRAWLNADVVMRKPERSKVATPVVVISNEGHSPAVAITNVESGFSPSELKSPNALLFEQLSLTHPLIGQSLMRISTEKDHLYVPYYSDLHKTYHPTLTMNAPIRKSTTIQRLWKKQYFYVWGDVLYQDAFNHRHVFTFCFEHEPTDAPMEMPGCSFLNTIGIDVPDGFEYVTPTVFSPRFSNKSEAAPL